MIQRLLVFLLVACVLIAGGPIAAHAQVDASGLPPTEWGSERPPPRVATDDEGLEQVSVPGKRVDLSLNLPSSSGPWTIHEVTLQCDLKDCEKPRYVEQLIAITGIHAGAIHDRDAMIRALNRLARVELFKKIHAELVDHGDGTIDVRFDAEAATLIRRIRIRSGPFPQESIKRRISLRSGGFWNPEEIPRQQHAIQEYFERQGMYGTDVVVTEEPAGPHAVDINIRIHRGQRLTINRIHVRGNNVLTYDEISTLVLDEFNFLSSFTQRDVQQAIDAVLRHYRELGYIQARFERSDIRVDDEQRSVDLYLEIREGPRWDISFIGNRVFSDEALRNALTFYETGFVDDVEIANAVREIRALYETRGYFFARVNVTQRRGDEGERVIVFRVDEGTAAEIRHIDFVGNTVFSQADLLEKMRTSEYDLITPSGYLQRARLNDELKQIVARYTESGYLGASIPRVVMVGQNGGRDLYLTIFIEEGHRTELASVSIYGGEETGPERAGERHEEAFEKLYLRQGKPWSAQAIAADQEAIRALWSEDGYGLARVQVHCNINGRRLESCAPVSKPQECLVSLANDVDTICQRTITGDTIVEECQTARNTPVCTTPQPLAGARVNVEFEIEPGVPTELARVFVVGNFETRAPVILQELPLTRPCMDVRRRRRIHSGWEPAGPCPYDPGQLLNMQANLRSLGVFDSVRIDAIGPDEDLDDVTLIVKVEEGQTRYVDYRIGIDLGFSQADRTLLSLPNEIIYRDLNFLGRAQELRLEARFEPSMTQPGEVFDGVFDADLRAIYFDPRAYIFGRWKRPWEARAEVAATWNQLAPAPAPQTRTLGLDLRIRNRIRRYTGVFYELGLSVRQTGARDTAEGLLDAPFQRVRILSLSPRITVELRDNPLNPKKGYFGEVGVEIAEDFFGLLGTESFTRVHTRHSGFIPMGDMVLALNVRFGAGFGSIYNRFRSDRRLSLPLGERFLLGGVNSVRGFSRDAIPTVGSSETGGDVMFTANIELRYPLIRALDVYGTMFFDAGQLAADISDLRLDETRMSAGVGVRWLIAGILPVLIDYGAIINRRPGEGFGRLHFSIGYTF